MAANFITLQVNPLDCKKMSVSLNISFQRAVKIILFLVLTFSSKFLQAQVSYDEGFPNITFEFPVEIVSSNDGLDRLFVVEQPGKIKVFPNRENVTEEQVSTFLDITNEVAFSSGQEIGLLGLAFHPRFTANRKFYVYYTIRDQSGRINMVLDEFTTSLANNNLVDYNSRKSIFKFQKNQNNSNHNGGKIAFGTDTYLYISIGDGGGGGDPLGNAQNLNTVFGSLLRIDVDLDGNNPIETNPETPNGNYEIPADNPLVNKNGLDEIFAWGIRNTWKFSFDAIEDKIWGADVGQADFEEINVLEKGGNYGWNRFEGLSIEKSGTNLVSTPDRKPFYVYNHDNGDVSITGGYVYRGTSEDPLLKGKYIYGDFVSGRVWSIATSETSNVAPELLFRTSGQAISSFGTDEANELYFSDYNRNAKIYKIKSASGEAADNPNEPVSFVEGDWEQIQTGVNGIVEAIAVDGIGNYYVGGEFSRAGGEVVSNLAVYSLKFGWRAFGSGTNGRVNAIEIDNNGHVYIGGSFSSVDGKPINNIAKWDGQNWSALSNGVDGTVLAINFDGDKVYAGGVFARASGIQVNNIALFEGNTWERLADATTGAAGTNNEIRSIAVDNQGTIFIGGNFDVAGGKEAARIAQWNGNLWSSLGNGTSGFVQAIAINDEFIYAGGNFSIAGGALVNRIARWNRNSNTWEGLSGGLSGSVNDLLLEGNTIYVGGSFESASGSVVNNLASWSKTEGWKALGEKDGYGVDVFVKDMELKSDGSGLVVGGSFSQAGTTSATNIAFFNTDYSSIICNSLPAPWTSLDIGNVAATGSACYVAAKGTYEVSGSGADIWNGNDEFHFVYQSLSGDGEIIAEVQSMEQTDWWAKAGVMMRNSTASDSEFVLMSLSPNPNAGGVGYMLQNRNQSGEVLTPSNNNVGPVFVEDFPYYMRLVREGDTFSGYASDENGNWELLGSRTIGMNQEILVGLAVTSHNDGVLNKTLFGNVSVRFDAVSCQSDSDGDGVCDKDDNCPNTANPDQADDNNNGIGDLCDVTTCLEVSAPWTSLDIGAVGAAGNACYVAANNTYEVSGSGRDIWGSSDEFYFVYQSLRGNGEIIAQVQDMEETNQWAKAGVMMRNTADADSEFVLMALSPNPNGRGVGYALQNRNISRESLDPNNNSIGPVPVGGFPHYVRLVREGDTFSGYASKENGNWELLGTRTIAMNQEILVGLAVTSHNDGVLNKTVFGNVSLNFDEISCELDSDGDGVCDKDDNCPNTANPDQADENNNGIGDLCDVTTCLQVSAPWTSLDIGDVAAVGDACYVAANGTYEISGSGADIWDGSDEFHFVYQSLRGDGEIIAQVQRMEETNQWAKAGVMMRNTTASDSEFVLMSLSPNPNGLGVGYTLQDRSQQAEVLTANKNNIGPVFVERFPYYVRLVREGNIFSGYASNENGNWELLGSRTITMNQEILVGLAVTSHNDGVLNKTIFGNVSTTFNTLLTNSADDYNPVLYPNPSDTEVTLSFKQSVALVDITLYDMLSRAVRVYTPKAIRVGNEYVLNLEALPQGTYFVKIQDDRGFQFQNKLIIQ